MIEDKIVAEVRKFRVSHAEEHGFDLDAIVRDIRKGEERLRKEGWEVIEKRAERRPASPTAVPR